MEEWIVWYSFVRPANRQDVVFVRVLSKKHRSSYWHNTFQEKKWIIKQRITSDIWFQDQRTCVVIWFIQWLENAFKNSLLLLTQVEHMLAASTCTLNVHYDTFWSAKGQFRNCQSWTFITVQYIVNFNPMD